MAQHIPSYTCIVEPLNDSPIDFVIAVFEGDGNNRVAATWDVADDLQKRLNEYETLKKENETMFKELNFLRQCVGGVR